MEMMLFFGRNGFDFSFLKLVVDYRSGSRRSMVFSRRTGTPANLAGWMQVGCRILAPK